jgi:hypothetical protein
MRYFTSLLEIPMESFVRAVEIGLKESELRDDPHYRPGSAMWAHAVRHCGYVRPAMLPVMCSRQPEDRASSRFGICP